MPLADTAFQIVGCSEVIGIAGSDDKCRWVESLGADKCLNYKSKTFEEDLKEATNGSADIYFDNVGVSARPFPLAQKLRANECVRARSWT